MRILWFCICSFCSLLLLDVFGVCLVWCCLRCVLMWFCSVFWVCVVGSSSVRLRRVVEWCILVFVVEYLVDGY